MKKFDLVWTVASILIGLMLLVLVTMFCFAIYDIFALQPVCRAKAMATIEKMDYEPVQAQAYLCYKCGISCSD